MKPFYSRKGIVLYHGNCLEVLPSIESADLVFTSPPYNMRTRIRNGQYTERERGEHFSKKYRHFDDALPIEEYYALHKIVIAELLRIAPLSMVNIQLVTGSKEAWFRLIGDYCKHLKDVIIWDKGEGQPAMHPACINRGHEQILCFESDATAGRAFSTSCFERGTMSDIWRSGRGGNGSVAGHGATFPLMLPVSALCGWTRAGDSVLDPFCGSGTTGSACLKMGRSFTGIEISEEYCQVAAERFDREIDQGNLFEAEPARVAHTQIALGMEL